ncbi:MAG: CinA family nicotinamide mononucleotide deamidase-related protein [Tissierellia bacterium]|nr:CinA family nicotinamide mononucleotide deamidase-related protein [Tissierellia bacterium]
MKAEIFSIGTEILLGNILDTNSKFLSEKLQDLGIDVYKRVTVGDNFDRLYDEMNRASDKVDYIICSGGLGPTSDDITKEVAIKLSERETYLDEKSFDKLKEYFKGNDVAIETNKKQAIFPKDAIILDNEIGTAPGAIIKTNKRAKIILMPGPPEEMKKMFNEKVMKYLDSNAIIKSRIVKIALLGEWDMARRADLTSENPTVSPYITSEGGILRITAKADTIDKANEMLNQKEKELREVFGNLVYALDNESKESVLIDLLYKRKEHVSTAESVTGGMIASSIINISGASNVIEESLVVYSDRAKEKYINVKKETLDKYTAVSEQTAREMLEGLYDLTRSELCIITTGYAHTGKIFVGIKYKDRRFIKELQLSGSRNHVRRWAKNKALDYAILMMKDN